MTTIAPNLVPSACSKKQAVLAPAISCLLMAGSVAGCGRSASRLEQMIVATGSERRFAGRLHGMSTHQPLAHTTVTRGAESADLDNLLELTREVKLTARESHDEQSQTDFGVWQLLNGNYEQAIKVFRALVRRGAGPRSYNDLAVAYLARFDAEQRPMDLLLAAQSAEMALKIDPASVEALYNRAMTLSKLRLRHSARQAWRRYRSVETDALWRQEAATFLGQESPSLEAEWARRKEKLDEDLRTVSDAAISKIVADFPFHARTWAEEELLVSWAREARRDHREKAAKYLRVAGAVGEALMAQRSEELVNDAANHIRNAWEEGSGHVSETLLEGLEVFADGLAAYREQRTATAEPLLREAGESLARAGNPLAEWAFFYAAICRYYDDAKASAKEFSDIAARIPPQRYAALAGRIAWLQGTIDKIQGRFQSSVGRTQQAYELLERSSGPGASAFARLLLAESYSTLGEHELGWIHRHRAFGEVPLAEGLRRNIAMWTEATTALRSQDALQLAGPLLEEALAVAEQWRRPIGYAMVYLERAGYRAHIGESEEAELDLEKAKAAIAELEPGGLRHQMQAYALVTEGLVRKEADPSRAVDLLSEAFDLQVATGFEYDVITSLAVRASAYRRLGNDLAAEADFEKAVDIYEGIRATVEDPFSRMRAFRSAQPAFENLIELSLAAARETREADAFLLAEQSRGRVLLDLAGAQEARDTMRATFADLARLEKEIPAGTVVAAYSLLPERLLCWKIERGSSSLLSLRVTPAQLRPLVEKLRAELEGGSPESFVQAPAGELYELLVRPLGLPPGAALVVVPDRFLSRVAWPALYDRRGERHLVVERALSLSPSATLLLHSIDEQERRRAEVPATLSVAVGNATTYAGRHLRRLPDAEAEARDVAGAYRRSHVLTGLEATRGRFRTASSNYDVIHFAGHALAEPDVISRSVLLFHPADAADSGAFSLDAILGLELDRTSLVVLAACQTLETLADDREGIFGLGGAFLAAGVPAVLASQWDVNDRWARRLMPLFHHGYAAGKPANIAWREAVLALLNDDSDERPSTSDWANYIVIGGVSR